MSKQIINNIVQDEEKVFIIITIMLITKKSIITFVFKNKNMYSLNRID